MNQGEDTNVQSLSRLLHTVLYDSSGWIRSNRWNIPAFLCSFGGQNEKKMSVDPGHFPVILFYLICSSKMICTLTERKYFPKTFSDGPFIAPFTWRPAHAAYCAFMLACSTAAVYGKLIYVAIYLDSSIPHSWYNTTGSVLIGRPALWNDPMTKKLSVVRT